MADKKITQLDAVTSAANTDLLLIVRDPSATPVNKKIELGDVFGETAQTVFSQIDVRATGEAKLTGANTTVSGATVKVVATTSFQVDGIPDFNTNKLRLRSTLTPSSNDNTIVGWDVGTFAWDSNYLYIAVSSTDIARVALSTVW